MLRDDKPGHPTQLAWSAFPATTRDFVPSTGDFMIDDLDAIVARLQANGVQVLKRSDDDPNGRFAWIVDPEGNKVELWEPKRTATP